MTDKSIKLIGLAAALAALLVIPTIVGAFNTGAKLSFHCVTPPEPNGRVIVGISFTNNDQDHAIKATAQSSIFDDTIDLGTINAGATQIADVDTSKESIDAGTVHFSFTNDDGTGDPGTLDVNFDAFSCDNSTTPTGTISPTDFPTSTPTSTPTPTSDVTSTPTETPAPSEVTITAGIDNTTGGTAKLTDFTIHVLGVNNVKSDFPAPDYPLSIPLYPGAFSVTESSIDGYTVTTSGDCAGDILEGEEKKCDIQFKYDPEATPTATLTPTETPTPTDSSGNNNCDNTDQSGNNDNNNCNQQNQNQGQDQTQNNNQNVNITINQPQPQVLGATTQLPSTGTPTDVWELFGAITPLGFFLRKITKK